MKKIAIFASGEGTNAHNIINYFKHSTTIKVELVLSNNSKANVLKRASDEGVKTVVFDKQSFYENLTTINILQSKQIDLIVLAGFLWKVPENLVNTFSHKIINIHPALLPKFGGKGMYGMNVHKAVVEGKETQTGISIHFVNNNYDEGAIIAQYKCTVEPTDTSEIVAHKVHELERQFFPKEIEKVLMNQD
ncbi:MAG: phosphoribosylglycinamide formyltransferase [Bacteroidia bacterium]